MDDAMRPFYTGWASGDALAQGDNSRYTQYGNTALNNTGAQNREMLEHINTMQKYFFTKKGPDGQPLDADSLRSIYDFVESAQVPFSQGVMTPAFVDPAAGRPRVGYEMPMYGAMPAATAAVPSSEPVAPPGIAPPMYPFGTGPFPPAAPTGLPAMEQPVTPQLPPAPPQIAAPVQTPPKKAAVPTAPIKKRPLKKAKQNGILDNQGGRIPLSKSLLNGIAW